MSPIPPCDLFGLESFYPYLFLKKQPRPRKQKELPVIFPFRQFELFPPQFNRQLNLRYLYKKSTEPKVKVKKSVSIKLTKSMEISHASLKQIPIDYQLETIRLTYLALKRIQARLSQSNLSKKIGVSRISIYLYENTKTVIPKEKLERITMFFKERPESFLANQGLVEVEKEYFKQIQFTHAGYKTLQRHNPSTKEVSIDNQNTVKVGTSYNKMLSSRWVR